MTKNYDFLVFIGRFQPLHNGHLAVIKQGLSLAKKMVVMIGSAHSPRTPRNPWNFYERESMIRGCFSEEENKRLITVPLQDSVYTDNRWVSDVQGTVKGLVTAYGSQQHRDASIGLIGHSKDHTSYYINLFPQWGSINVDNVDGLNATDFRKQLFEGELEGAAADPSTLPDTLPEGTKQVISKSIGSPEFNALVDEYRFVKKYRDAWKDAPYEPTFVTTDAVVIQSGHVLMVERKAYPGKGLMALPGGFIKPSEKLVDGMVRELREETKLKVPEPVLRGCIDKQDVFDDPLRSDRGRTITHAYRITLKNDQRLPKVKGSDDAAQAFWVPIADLDPEKIFEDHYFIIQEMLG